MHRRLATALVLLLAAGAGCSRCAGGRSAASAEELLAAGTPLAATTGQLGALGQHGSALVDRAAAIPGGEQLGDLRRQLSAQLGFDPFSRDGLLAAGLDPDRGAAFTATLPDGPKGRPAWIVALPLTNPDRFSTAVEKLLRERSGFPLRAEEARANTKVIVFARSGAPSQRVAYAIVKGYGLLARSDDPAADIAAAEARKREQGLAVSPAWIDAKKLLKPEQGAPGDVLVYAPADSELGSRLANRPLEFESAVALAFGAQGLSARIALGLQDSDRQRVAAVLPGGGGDLLPFAPREHFFQLRAGLAPAEVAPLLGRELGARDLLTLLRAEMKARSADLDKDLFGSLKPGVVLSAGIAPGAELAKVIDWGFLDWRHHSPFEFVQLVALAEVANRDRLAAALEAVAASMPKFGATAAPSGNGWQVRYAGGEGARFGTREIGGRTIAYLVGGGIAPEQLAAGPAGTDPALAGSQGAVAAVDLGKLAAALRALPESTYGSGPQSYIARSLVGQVIEPLKALRASAHVAPAPRGLQLTLSLEIVAAPESPAQNPRP